MKNNNFKNNAEFDDVMDAYFSSMEEPEEEPEEAPETSVFSRLIFQVRNLMFAWR